MHTAAVVPLVLVCAATHALAQGSAPTTRPTGPKPQATPLHPIISEVMFAVPSGSDGDYDQDGTRNATGDEFVELFNPHDTPIQLKGYRLLEGKVQTRKHEQAPDATKVSKDEDRLDLTFPEFTLPAGGVVVVFNGLSAQMSGPVGNATKGPESGHESFHGAFVFTFGATSKFQALSNTNDMVQLLAPDGTGVSAVSWDFREEANEHKPPANEGQQRVRGTAPRTKGTDSTTSPAPEKARERPARRENQPAKKELPKHADVSIPNLMRIEKGTWTEGSVQRASADGGFVSHASLDATLASPGRFPHTPAAKTSTTTTDAPR